MKLGKFKATAMLGLAVASTMSLASCAAPEATPTTSEAPATIEATTITWLTQDGEAAQAKAAAIVAAFNKEYPQITVEIHGRPGGADGDNLVKTKLATGAMEDVFDYNTGALLVALNPATTILPVTNEAFQDNVLDGFKAAVTVGGELYGAPYDVAAGGGIYYNTKVFEAAGITDTPKTWDELIADAQAIKATGVDAICSTFADSWTAQLLVLADFYNVHVAEPNFVAEYDANQAKYAEVPAALQGFEYLQQVTELGLTNKDAATATYDDAIARMSDGTCGMYAMGTWFTSSLTGDAVNEVGFFPMPGKDANNVGLTTWMPSGMYVNAATQNVDAAKAFQAFIASKAASDALDAAVGFQGPYMTKDQSPAPADAPLATRNLADLIANGNSYPALEFLSAIKGPNLPGICVQVATLQVTAAEGAALYDQDVVAQAQQLGLAGW